MLPNIPHTTIRLSSTSSQSAERKCCVVYARTKFSSSICMFRETWNIRHFSWISKCSAFFRNVRNNNFDRWSAIFYTARSLSRDFNDLVTVLELRTCQVVQVGYRVACASRACDLSLALCWTWENQRRMSSVRFADVKCDVVMLKSSDVVCWNEKCKWCKLC